MRRRAAVAGRDEQLRLAAPTIHESFRAGENDSGRHATPGTGTKGGLHGILWNFRLQIRQIHSRRLGKVRHRGQHCVQATYTPAADTCFTEKDISQDADHGQNNYDNDPGNSPEVL